MSYFYQQAFNSDGDPLYSCRYGITTNLNYHKCLKCSGVSYCQWLHDFWNLRKILGDEIAVKNKCVNNGRCVECDFVAHCQILRGGVNDGFGTAKL